MLYVSGAFVQIWYRKKTGGYVMYALDVRCLINVSNFQSNIELLLGDLQPAFVWNVEKICISCSL